MLHKALHFFPPYTVLLSYTLAGLICTTALYIGVMQNMASLAQIGIAYVFHTANGTHSAESYLSFALRSIFKDSAFRLNPYWDCRVSFSFFLLFPNFCARDSVKMAQPNSTKFHMLIDRDGFWCTEPFGLFWPHSLGLRRGQRSKF